MPGGPLAAVKARGAKLGRKRPNALPNATEGRQIARAARVAPADKRAADLTSEPSEPRVRRHSVRSPRR
jgi:hypothetical protein